MGIESEHNTRLDVCLSPELKEVIEEAASALGQSVSDFAVSTLVQHARSVIQQRDVTELTTRDRDRFLAILDDPSLEPNQALAKAANRYKMNLG